MNVARPMVGGKLMTNVLVRLKFDEEAIRLIGGQGEGALWFPEVELKEGAKFVAAWHQDDCILAAFLAEVAAATEVRKLVLAPLHFRFPCPTDVDLAPLGGVAVPALSVFNGAMVAFGLYEARAVYAGLGVN